MHVSSTYRPQNQTLPQGNLAATASYTFSAKERDVETGLSYFGARYYSSDLSIWFSVDPMSDKYPSLSPYVYCADNPVKLVDIDGCDWVLSTGNKVYWYAGDKGIEARYYTHIMRHLEITITIMIIDRLNIRIYEIKDLLQKESTL